MGKKMSNATIASHREKLEREMRHPSNDGDVVISAGLARALVRICEALEHVERQHEPPEDMSI